MQVAGNLRIANDTRRKQGLSALLEASRQQTWGRNASCCHRRHACMPVVHVWALDLLPIISGAAA